MTPLTKAWLCLIGLPLASLASIVVGSLIFSLLGMTEGSRLPVAYLPLMLLVIAGLLAIPTWLTIRYGRLAREHGARHPYRPAMIAVGYSTLMLAINIVSYLFVS